MEGVTLSIIFSILVSFMTNQVYILDPQFTTQTDFVNYQVTLLPQNLQLVGRGGLQLNYKAYVTEYYYFTDNSITNNLLKFYNVYAYSLYGKRVKSIDKLMKLVSSANYPVYPVYSIVLENTLNVKQELKIVKLFYVIVDNNKYLVIPYYTDKYVFMPVVKSGELFKVSVVESGVEPVDYSDAVESVQLVLDDVGVEENYNELEVSISGTYTKNGVTSIDVVNPNDYFVVITLFNYKGGLNDYFTFYVPPSSEKHLNIGFIPTHAVIWKGFRPRLVKLSLSFVPLKYMVPEKSEYYEGETVRINLSKGTVGDYEIEVVQMSNMKKIQVVSPSSLSKYFQFQAPKVPAFSDDMIKVVLKDKETGLIIETLYLTVKSKIYIKSVFVDLEEGEASITLSQPLSKGGAYTVDITTMVCPTIKNECGIKKKELSSFDLESRTITAELDVEKILMGYNKITVRLDLQDPAGKTIQYSKTVYKYVSPDLFINDISLDYNFLNGNKEYLYKGGEVKLKINVNDDLVNSKKKLFVVVYVNNRKFKSIDISSDVTYTIPIKHSDNYLLVTVYVNNIQVFSTFYLTKPKPIYVLLIQNSWIFIISLLVVSIIVYRQRQKHPEMRLMQKYDIRKARKQIEEHLRMKVIEKIGTDATNVFFIHDVANNTYITGWVSQFTKKAYLLVTDLMLNTILETELPPEELLKMMQKISQGENPYDVAVDTYNTVKAEELSELARDVHEDMMQTKIKSASISGLDSLETPQQSLNEETSDEQKDIKLLDKLDNFLSEGLSEDTSLIDVNETQKPESEERVSEKEKSSSEELDFDLDLDLDLDLDI